MACPPRPKDARSRCFLIGPCILTQIRSLAKAKSGDRKIGSAEDIEKGDRVDVGHRNPLTSYYIRDVAIGIDAPNVFGMSWVGAAIENQG